MAPLSGRVALVTGASRRVGIGAAIARRLAADGAAVLLHGFEPHDASQPWGADSGGLRALASELGGRVATAVADLTDPAAPRALVQQALDEFGGLDIVVANHARSGRRLADRLAGGSRRGLGHRPGDQLGRRLGFGAGLNTPVTRP